MAIGIAVAASIGWAPIRQNWIYVAPLGKEAVQNSLQAPTQAVLEAAASATPGSIVTYSSPEQRHEAALNVAKGNARDPVSGMHQMKLPFSVEDVSYRSETWQLLYASLEFPAMLLDDFERYGERSQFLLARDMIDGFARWEEGLNWPVGYVWNDHAIAARLGVLIRFWRQYRHAPEFDPVVAGHVLQAVQRAATRLATARTFTFNTNHGLMQNLALMQASIAFPALADAKQWGEIGRQRLARQLDFFVSPEGYVLEHSPDYHQFGQSIVETAISLEQFMDGPEQLSAWAETVQRGKQLTAWMRRPDGSLPVFGDTLAGPPVPGPPGRTAPPKELAELKRFALFPVSGLGGWSSFAADGQISSQTTAQWGYFKGHGHGHADELSIALWLAGGIEILNTGYWPSTLPGRSHAEGWQGGNAPHFLDEKPLRSRPTPDLLAYVNAQELRGLVMRRLGAAGEVQRQLFQAGDNVWIVLDVFNAQDKAGRGEVLWFIDAELESQQGGNELVWRAKPNPAQRLRGRFAGADSPQTCGAMSTFMDGLKPVGCVSLRAAGAQAALATVWSADVADDKAAKLQLDFSSATQWTLSGLGDKTWNAIARAGDELRLQKPTGEALKLALRAPADVSKARMQMEAALLKLGAQYPKYVDIDSYRLRVGYAALALLAAQALALALIALWRRPGYLAVGGAGFALLWLAVAAYLHGVYFVV